MSYLERYLAGQHIQVWQELVDFGPIAEGTPRAADAFAVAREATRRVLANLNEIARRTRKLGYVFECTEGPLVLADASAGQRIEHVEMAVGRLPIVAKAWFERIERVDFTLSPLQTPREELPPPSSLQCELEIRSLAEAIERDEQDQRQRTFLSLPDPDCWRFLRGENDVELLPRDPDELIELFVGPTLSNCEEGRFTLGHQIFEDRGFAAGDAESFFDLLRWVILEAACYSPKHDSRETISGALPRLRKTLLTGLEKF